MSDPYSRRPTPFDVAEFRAHGRANRRAKLAYQATPSRVSTSRFRVCVGCDRLTNATDQTCRMCRGRDAGSAA